MMSLKGLAFSEMYHTMAARKSLKFAPKLALAGNTTPVFTSCDSRTLPGRPFIDIYMLDVLHIYALGLISYIHVYGARKIFIAIHYL